MNNFVTDEAEYVKPGVQAALNTVMARHPKFILIQGASTYGKGPMKYWPNRKPILTPEQRFFKRVVDMVYKEAR